MEPEDEKPKHVATVPGYRRARQSEVTPEMSQAATDALRLPLGEVLFLTTSDGIDFAVALEEHYHAPGSGLTPEGVHKREAERARLNAEIREMRSEARARCNARKQRVERLARTERQRIRRKLEEEERFQREMLRAEGKARKASAKRRTATEQRQESDDEVRANLPTELVPVFDRFRRQFRGTAHKSRTEAFLQWVEENPGEVVAVQQAAADAELARLIAEHERMERAEARRRKKKRRNGNDVPF